jgi:hypothetical protein
MKRGLFVLAALALPAAAFAQGAAPITATPLLPPPQVATPQPAPDSEAQPPPAADQMQAAPAPEQQQQQNAPPQDTATQEAPPPSPQVTQLTWLPQRAAQLQVLDKVNAQSTVLTVKVGQQGQFGSLTIQVQACDIHPPDVPQDAAAYLKISDSHSDSPGFQGWMLADNPSVSMLQNPVYDVRVVGCQA